MHFRKIWALVREAFASWSDDYAQSMGAALAYYTLFSIAPLLLLALSIAGLAFGREAAEGQVFAELSGLMGPDSAAAVQALLSSASEPAEGIVGTLVSAAMLLIGATTVLGELQDALDRIWRAPQRDRRSGLFELVRTRLLSFGMIVGIGFLLIVSLLASAALSALGSWWAPLFGGWVVALEALNFVVSFAIVTAAFALVYKAIPRVRVQWRDVWVGALVTALLFTIGKFLIGLYIGTSGVGSAYGAAASLIVVLVWVYYSAQIFLLGAEFTWVYANTMGSRRGLAATRAGAGDVPSRSGDSAPEAVASSRAAIADALAAERPDDPAPAAGGPAARRSRGA